MERLTELELQILQAMRELDVEQMSMALEFLNSLEDTDCHGGKAASQ